MRRARRDNLVWREGIKRIEGESARGLRRERRSNAERMDNEEVSDVRDERTAIHENATRQIVRARRARGRAHILSTMMRWAAFAGSVTAASAAHANPVDIPAALAVPAHQTLKLEALGVGVQNYRCAPAANDPTQFGWVFMSPEATLFGTDRHRIGIHYGGPTWEAKDGSKIVGTVKAQSPSPAAGAIPWLLLDAKPIERDGTFGAIRAVLRLHTTGGVAPSMPCNATTAGRIARVPYSADYYFYGPDGADAKKAP